MNDQQLLRYARHLMLDDLGIEGQERLLDSHALIVGAGGLGSPAALYLATAGVGHLTLADPDTVDLTNLQRQILHTTDSVGQPKVVSGQTRLAQYNPDVRVTPLAVRLEGDALYEAVSKVDVVLDCSDNFATRMAVNAACVQHRKPLVLGAAVRYEGQVSVFDLRQDQAPCYHCLFPEADDATDESCATMGVFAPLVGIIGAMQAAEALKLLAEVGQSLSGRLLWLDAKLMQWRSVNLRRDPACPVCGHRPVAETA